MPPLEILVHVSAPSQGRDDARYRTEAKGFLDFEAVGRHLLSPSSEYGEGGFGRKNPSIQGAHLAHLPQTDIERDKDIKCGLGRHGRHETSSTEKSVDNSTEADQNADTSLSSTRDDYRANEHGENDHGMTHIPHEPLSSVTSEAAVNFSSIQRGSRMELSIHHTPSRQSTAVLGTVHRSTQNLEGRLPGTSSKTPSRIWPEDTLALPLTSIEETPRLLIERTPALPRPRTAPTPATPSQRAQPLRRTHSDSWQTPPSTIPDSQPHVPSYNSPKIMSPQCAKRPLRSSSPSPTRPFPPVSKKPRIQIPSSPPREDPALKSSRLPTAPISSSPAPPPSSPPPPTHISSSPPLSTPNTNPLEIHPPRPKISTARFSTHLTPSLTNHTAQITDCYPKYKKTQTRALHPLERGHWLVPFSGQDLIFQKDLWEFLNGYISSGRAGWGVWAVREDANPHNTGGKGKDIDASNPISWEKEELLKVYCWGEVVAEVWLVMYMGGKRKIKGLGSQWVDAQGDAVVLMI